MLISIEYCSGIVLGTVYKYMKSAREKLREKLKFWWLALDLNKIKTLYHADIFSLP